MAESFAERRSETNNTPIKISPISNRECILFSEMWSEIVQIFFAFGSTNYENFNLAVCKMYKNIFWVLFH